MQEEPNFSKNSGGQEEANFSKNSAHSSHYAHVRVIDPVTSPFYSYRVIDPCAASMNTMKICILSCIPTPPRSSVIATTIHMRLGSNPNYVLHGTYDNLRAVFANPNFMFYVLDNLRTSMNQASKNSEVTRRNESNRSI